MADEFSVRYEGVSAFVATDRSPKRVLVILECRDGLVEGADVRVSPYGNQSRTHGMSSSTR